MAADQFRLVDPDLPFADRYLAQFESGHEVESVLHSVVTNADWMVGNTVLALIPLWLARRLFVAGVQLLPLRLLAWAAFIAFLPNALYVATDLIHLGAAIDQLGSTPAVVLVLVPLYALFVAIGVSAYTACLVLLYRWALLRIGAGRAMALATLLHLACACGIYLGRVVRLNSWEFVTDPGGVLDGIATMLSRPEALAYVLTVVVGGALLVLLTRPAAQRLFVSVPSSRG